MAEPEVMCFCLFFKKKNRTNSAFTTKIENKVNKKQTCNHEEEDGATPDMSKNKYKKKHHDNNQKESGAAPEETENITIFVKHILKCKQCALQILNCVCYFEGVGRMNVEIRSESNMMITAWGNIDPLKLKEKLENVANRQVQLISSSPTVMYILGDE